MTYLTVIAIVAAGNNTPPTPKPEIVPRAVPSFGFSGVMHARAPLNAATLSLTGGIIDGGGSYS